MTIPEPHAQQRSFRFAAKFYGIDQLICCVRSPVPEMKESKLAKKTVKLRAWTATDIHKLKGLAKKKVGVDKIAKALKRTVAATAVKAHLLGVSLDTRG
jgi:hypothetical protein